MEYKIIIDKLKNKGIVFANGLTKEEFSKVENLYNIKFPKELKNFLAEGLPFAEYTSYLPNAGEKEYCHYVFLFPVWNDFSEENIKKIKDWIAKPKRLLREEYENVKNNKKEIWTFCNDLGLDFEKKVEEINKEFDIFESNLENTIPIFGHRYMLQNDNSPILLITKTDDIALYGKDLQDYLECEFLDKRVDANYEKADLGNWYDVLFR